MERLAGRVILLWGWRRALVAFGAGALAVPSQAPFDFFAVCLVSFPLLVWLLDGAVPGFEFHVLDADPRRVKRVRIVPMRTAERRRRALREEADATPET